MLIGCYLFGVWYDRSHLFALFSSLYVIILAFFVVGLVIGVTAKPRTRAKAEWMFVA